MWKVADANQSNLDELLCSCVSYSASSCCWPFVEFYQVYIVSIQFLQWFYSYFVLCSQFMWGTLCFIYVRLFEFCWQIWFHHAMQIWYQYTYIGAQGIVLWWFCFEVYGHEQQCTYLRCWVRRYISEDAVVRQLQVYNNVSSAGVFYVIEARLFLYWTAAWPMLIWLNISLYFLYFVYAYMVHVSFTQIIHERHIVWSHDHDPDETGGQCDLHTSEIRSMKLIRLTVHYKLIQSYLWQRH